MDANGKNSSCSGDWKWGSPNLMIVEIMILVFHMIYLLVFLAVFGTWRRRSRSLFWKVMLWISYTTSIALIPYILGLIREAPFKDELLIIWGMLLLIAYAFPDSFSAYSPEDLKQWRLHYVRFLVKFLALAILWVFGSLDSKVHSNLNFGVMALFTLIVFLKVMKRSMANIVASPPSIEERAKLSEVYMTSEHNMSDESGSNPVTMKGYHYFVAVAGSKRLTLDDVLPVIPSNLTKLLERNDMVTLEKVWNCQGKLLTQSGDQDNRLKDICLSYSLLKILYLKIADYVLPVEAHPKARKLILDGLISNENNRAFRVTEVELKLLYELIYTKYPLYASPIFAGLRVLEFVLLLSVCGLSSTYMSKYADSLEYVEVDKVLGFNLEVLVTFVLLGMIVFADIAQVWMIFSSEWVKAALIFNYVANKYCLNNIFAEKLITMVCKPHLWKPWARLLGQYSLIESQGYGTNKWISNIAHEIYPDKNRDWQTQRKAVHLSEEVKGAVLDYLRINGLNLENGRRSLRRNQLSEELQWACEGKHLAEVILVWHIATSYCKRKLLVCRNSNKNCKAANHLSNYLAYLVAFAPRLLPEPHFEPQFYFSKAMKEAREVFEGCKKVEERIDKLDELAMKEDHRIIVRGARLGKTLLQLGCDQHVDIWKTLAEFWSEMALCGATSGEVREHLVKLANGGEFITHLWALLHHAGYSPAHPVVLK